MTVPLYENAEAHYKRSFHIPILHVIGQAAVRDFFTGGDDELSNNN